MPFIETEEIDSIGALLEKGTYFDTLSALQAVGHPMPGTQGEVLPYSLQSDVLVAGLLILCFLLICVSLNRGGRFIVQQLRDFFVERSRGNLFEEDTSEFRYPLLLVPQTALSMGIICFALFLSPGRTALYCPTWISLLLALGINLLLIVVRYLFYGVVNWVFFSKPQRTRWFEIYSLVISLEGVALFVLACLVAYFGFSDERGLFCLAFVLLTAKFLLFCKCFSIFFEKIYGFFCNILYFCTLEMIPLLFLLKIFSIINESWTLKI